MPAESYGPLGCVVHAGPEDQSPTRAKSGRAAPGEQFSALLADWLCFMVPMFIAELRNASDEQIEHERAKALEQIANHGDDLQFGGKHQGSSRTALAKGLAILARAEEGVTALGIHACTAPHIGCPGLASSFRPHTDHPEAAS
jgi:hypothetical protein